MPTHLERRGVAFELCLALRREAAEARAEHPRAHERCPAAGHVDDAGAREIDDAGHHRIGVEGGEEAFAVPDPMHHDRVDEACAVRVRVRTWFAGRDAWACGSPPVMNEV